MSNRVLHYMQFTPKVYLSISFCRRSATAFSVPRRRAAPRPYHLRGTRRPLPAGRDLMCGQDAVLEQMRAVDDDAPATPLEAVFARSRPYGARGGCAGRTRTTPSSGSSLYWKRLGSGQCSKKRIRAGVRATERRVSHEETRRSHRSH